MIKVLLVAGILGTGALLFRGRATASHLAIRRMAAGVVLLLGIGAIMSPGSVTWLANKVGVGRGADLLLYGLVFAFLFVTVGIYQRLLRLEDRYVALARRVALDTARHNQVQPPETARDSEPVASARQAAQPRLAGPRDRGR